MNKQENNIQNHETPTQMFYAKNNIITPQMRYVAKIEGLEVDFVKEQIAAGSMIIPANINHTNLTPMAIGIETKTKVNANIGNSSLASDIGCELNKLEICLKYHYLFYIL